VDSLLAHIVRVAHEEFKHKVDDAEPLLIPLPAIESGCAGRKILPAIEPLPRIPVDAHDVDGLFPALCVGRHLPGVSEQSAASMIISPTVRAAARPDLMASFNALVVHGRSAWEVGSTSVSGIT